jgi:hypothetical protein
MRTRAVIACASMRSTLHRRSVTSATSRLAWGLMRWYVQVLRNLPTHTPPVYRAARLVGRMWLVLIDLSPYATVVSSPMNSEPFSCLSPG